MIQSSRILRKGHNRNIARDLARAQQVFVMAASEGTERGGYNYKFVITPPSTLICFTCKLVSRDPQLSVCCGTNFCKICLEARTSNKHGCPVCSDWDNPLTTFPNKMSDREIKKLPVLCTNSGCDWQGELAKMDVHLMLSCKFQEVQCSNGCGMIVPQQKLTHHLENDCTHRKVNCEHCSATGKLEWIVGEHKDQCPKLPIACPNECGLTNIARNELKKHLEECPLRKVRCAFHDIGCEAMINSSGQEEHDETCMKDHFQLMRSDLVKTKEQLTAAKVNATTIKEEVQKSRNVHNKLQRVEQEFDEWKELTCTVFCGIMHSLEWKTRMLVSSMLLSQSKLVAPVIVRIPGFSEKKASGESFFSPQFYTHHFGYRACLRVIPFGIDDCKGTHVYVSVDVLDGPNDVNLRWPVKGKFTVSLLNQVKNNNHYIHILEVNPKENDAVMNSCKNRATIQISYHKGFIQHHDLMKSSTAYCYCVGDTLYFQVMYSDKP